MSPPRNPVRFNDVLNDYRVNRKRSLDELERRIRLHLEPWFGRRRMAALTTPDVRAYIAKRQADTIVVHKDRPGQPAVRRPVSNGEINRELATLKRIFTLAVQAGKLLHRPYIPMLREAAPRQGFFERDQFMSVQAQLPEALRPVVEFAYITGWRVPSEVLPLQWRSVDLKGGEIRLDAGSTKNGEGRVFPMTDDLRALLEARRRLTKQLERQRRCVIPWVFFRMVAIRRGGPTEPRPIRTFTKAWAGACLAAGCPGRIPHDLRRTAVRNMVRRGVPERIAMTLTGHKTRSVFERYNIVSEGDLRTAAALLQGLTGTIQGQSVETSRGRSTKSVKLFSKFGGAARN
jgi:integrase